MNGLLMNNNFNTCSQIFSALEMISVRRLTKSWSEVPRADMEIYEKIGEAMSMASNFSAYRELLKLVPVGSSCIPRIEVVLKDLTFTEEYKDTTDNGNINFVKIHKLYRALQSIYSFQTYSRNFKFVEDEEIIKIYT